LETNPDVPLKAQQLALPQAVVQVRSTGTPKTKINAAATGTVTKFT
jgi:hypothetical protein